ncbi:MAG: (Fe-S)-binding protein [Desulfobacula sp.]|jgi:glycolate oxidase iron-sulfur subunit|uniref:(Fe-S)-binding protein n=1 Tax=Desulfobacula sp. TaxID=2593537 RepID=UPI001D9240FE|nr:(Fe-S)-binding protein [Desulfobacula sp.]MBT3484771.1 (Fe-S)-binding protein [Desulfobacula sp.]MBT3804400.1 (Fe-S)-binding protein [Desulfobacula sp.]MBT4025191.1 (Fe-S)-binding protein [Desulfobacula sp.]MBT4198594.1 (Fe-S)-binding protein [Desulfobacula sp.]
MTQKLIQNCGKCGLCLYVCPVYKILKKEQDSPRGKLQLIKAYDNKDLASSPLLKEIVSKCLMCGSCAANCPSGINHYSKFMEMRRKMVESQGQTPAIKSLIYLLGREHRLKFGAGLARTGQNFIPDNFAGKYKFGSIPLKNFPKLNSIPLRKANDEVILPYKKQIGTVVYFTGCATNYLYDDTGFAFIEILKHMGYTIIIPKDQTCCSIPLLFHGAADKAFKNIIANINAIKNHDADAILVDCSTCGEALKNEYPRFIENKGYDPFEAKKISSKVMDALSFIDKNFDRLEFDSSVKEKVSVTYHAPCHTRNSFGSHKIFENLIEKLPFVNYKKTVDVDECCGGGGTFFYEYPEISKKMVDKKIENAKAVKASLWLTDCPVCRMNIAGNLNHNDNLQVLHPLTLIHSALKQI